MKRFFVPAFALLLLLLPAIGSAQSNFAFWMGGTGVSFDSSDIHWGTSVGANGKFNITDLILVRGQFNVDRAQLKSISLDRFQGTQTNTFICLGLGPEIGIGTTNFDFLAHSTIHGTIRSVSRIVSEEGQERLVSVTRFSMGLVLGAGGEWFVTDNLGVEVQGQYDIYNFDSAPGDPRYIGLRAFAGVQFYLGRNFLR